MMSEDYQKLTRRERLGLWNVPCIFGSYLIQGKILKDDKTKPNFDLEVPKILIEILTLDSLNELENTYVL